MVLRTLQLPGRLPHEFRVAYVPGSKELVIEYELPKVDIVRLSQRHRYIKSKDVIARRKHGRWERSEIYIRTL